MIVVVIWFLIVAVPLIVWLLFRSGGYKRTPLDAPPPGPGWALTPERFVDPASGETLDVWYCARTGERAYVRMQGGGRVAP
jgi:hypothetical protein